MRIDRIVYVGRERRGGREVIRAVAVECVRVEPGACAVDCQDERQEGASIEPSREHVGPELIGVRHGQTGAVNLSGVYQGLDSDLTAIAALSTTSFGRGFLVYADEAAFKAGVNLEIGVDVEAFDADILKADVSDDLDVGFTSTSKNGGTVSSGTFTPAFATGNVQHYTNNGAHTLAPPSSGNGSIVIDTTNGASAGAITTSGFTKVTGDTFTTTNGHKFRCFITVGNGGSHLHKQALQ